MDYKNLIEKRQSCRDFTNKEIEQSSIKIIKEFFKIGRASCRERV